MKLLPAVVPLVVLAGCSFAVDVQRDAKAPTLPPSSFVEVVERPPEAGSVVHLARVEAQGNNWQNSDDCNDRLVAEAKELGGDLVFVQRIKGRDIVGTGPECVGEVYQRRK